MLRYVAKVKTRFLKVKTRFLLGVRSTAERGATAVEYGLIVASVIGVALLALPALGVALNGLFDQSTRTIVVP